MGDEKPNVKGGGPLRSRHTAYVHTFFADLKTLQRKMLLEPSRAM